MKKETSFHTLGPDRIALHRFSGTKSSYPPVLLIHGSIENGKIFYSNSGKGLAPFLAKNGFDVFVADLRGKGDSTPAVNKNTKANQTSTIREEIPLLIQKVQEMSGQRAVHLGAHSWGGVMLLAAYALFHEQWNIKSMIFFGTKRRIGIFNFNRFKTLDLGWSLIGSLATLIAGYLPAKKLKMGSDDEPAGFYFQVNRWVYAKSWTEKETGIDFSRMLQSIALPPVHLYTGINDKLLGHPKDVQRLANELGPGKAAVKVLGIQAGNKHNYNHINILTHPDAQDDHFLEVLQLLKKYSA